MRKRDARLMEVVDLRRHAEKLCCAQTQPAGAHPADPTADRLFHELQVQQIELELQNTELCRVRGELEKALEGYTDLYVFAPVGYFSLDREAIIRTVNLSGASLLGISRSQLVGRRFSAAVSSGTRSVFAAFLANVMENTLDASCEVTLLRVGRDPLFVRIEAARCQSGQECLIVVIDTTKEKQALVAQQQSEAQFELIFNANLDAIYIVDLEGKLLEVNQASCRFLGYSRAELLTMQLKDIYLPEYADLVPARIREVVQQGTVVAERVYLAKGGRQIPLELHSSTMVFRNQPAILSVARDITERQLADRTQLESHNRLECRVADSTAKLVEATERIKLSLASGIRLETELLEAKKMETIGQLAAGVAHEVRNPLNAILSLTEALFRERGIAANPEYDPYIVHIRSQVGRLSQLMKDLLELGRSIPASSLQPVQLHQVCSDTVTLLASSGLLETRRVTVVSDHTSADALVLADPVKLQQVLFNVLENAAQHTPAGGEILLFLVPAARCAPFMAVVQITDCGEGIPADRIERVFDPFYTGRKGGTGLGLTLVRHFIEHMGGSVAIANNQPPPGCTVEIRIPLAMRTGK
jgi:PAS domain S-box-containing protein